MHKVWTVNEGGKLIIVCTSPIGGSVDWLHNDVPIATSLGRNRFTVRAVTVGNQLRHYLTVKDVRQQDAGRYTCRQTYSDHRHINVSRLNGQTTHSLGSYTYLSGPQGRIQKSGLEGKL